MTQDTANPSPATPRHAALTRLVTQLEEHVSRGGWDAPVGVFALVRTAAALEEDPALARMLDAVALAEARADAEALTAIEQGDLPPANSLEELLAGIVWPDEVDGTAVATERMVLPADAEQRAADIADPDERAAYLMSRPDRDDVRIVVGVLRSGESWCAVRSRSHDSADAVATGADLVPGLVEALRRTLQ
ncbi:PPA1309 family protein [Actinomyces sp. MRS3W]|uniref:PPA1309 family protein n=1 Tax=Actinomyces sp. MRS3W TaxID=2800796 RepID=UPI0028FD2FB8|nr:PPA1309 family protein [Actinomyces sp. MRS3W]MDU0348201.1 PPA1309 family protein [Actinomyces sp. MRS3W]